MDSIHVEHRVTAAAARPSDRVLHCAAMFGLGVDDDRELMIVASSEIPLPSGGIVFITGPSGGGKSTLLRLIAAEAAQREVPVIDGERLPQPPADLPLIDCLGATLDQSMRLLSLAGLADAFVMLRRVGELSDGQRRRLMLARLLESAERRPGRSIMLADEFAATIDRITAMSIARSVRRWISRTCHTFIAATTHDDLLEALRPDVLVWKGLGDEISVATSTRPGIRPGVQTRPPGADQRAPS